MIIPSRSVPGATFELVTGWDAEQQVRERLGDRAKLARWPHHTSSAESLTVRARYSPDTNVIDVNTGEMLLAGAGLLVLQDIAEFSRYSLDGLGTAWMQGYVMKFVTGAKWAVKIPVRCSILATSLECPCGMKGRPGALPCRCSAGMLGAFRRRLEAAVKAFGELRLC